MKERVGSFVVDGQGNLVPNMDDEAMAERERREKLSKQQAAETSGTEVAQ